MVAERSASLCGSPCGSASSTTASSPTPSAAPSAGIATSAERSGGRRHDVTYLTLRQWDRGRARRACPACAGGRRAAHGRSTRRRAAAHPAAARVRRRRALAPAAPRPALRRRAHCLVPLLLAAGRGCARGRSAATGWWWTGSRSGRATTGASTSARSAAAIGWLRAARSACASRSGRSASRALHASRLRAEGLRGAADGARGRVRRAARAARAGAAGEPVVVFAGRHIPEKRRAGAGGGDGRGARPRSRSCAATIFGDGPDRDQRCCEAIEREGLGELGDGAGLRRRRRGGARAARTRSAWCCPPAARATGWWWWRPPRCGTPSVVVADPDNAAVELIETGVNGVSSPRRPSDLAAAIVAVHEGGQRCAARPRSWFAEHAPALSVQSSMAAILRQLERANGHS